MQEKLYRVDGALWEVDIANNIAIPICPKHKMELKDPLSDGALDFYREKHLNGLSCRDCRKSYLFPRNLHDERKYVVDKIAALERSKYNIIDIDGTLTPVTKKEKIGENECFFCTAQVRDSKRGPQVVIYAGKKGSGKSQIFVTPKERRLSFDQNDINPSDVFTKITAEFYDGSKHIIERGGNEA